MPKKTIYILQNCFWGKNTKTSGGDVRFCHIFSLIDKFFDGRSLIFTNKEGVGFDKKFNLGFNYVKTYDIFDKFGIYISYLLRTIFVCLKILFSGSRDIFYSLSDFFPDVIPPFLFKNKNNRWIQVIHHIYLPPVKRDGNFMKNCIAYYLQRFSFFLIKNRATKIIVVNSLVKDALLGYGLDVNKIEVSSNAINIEYFNKIDTNITLAYDGVFIGRLSKVKGVFDLIEIWKKVNIKSYKYRLAIIGGGDTKIINDLNDIIRKNNLSSSVFVLGYIENEKAYSVLKSSKVFLFPSHEEGWGIVIAEAMACGLPVVSWDLPVFREVFLDHTFQIREGNTNEFASKVSDLLSDTQLRKKMSETGYDFIKQYSWAKIAEKEKRIVTV